MSVKRPCGNDASGFTNAEQDERIADLASRKALFDRTLTVVCGLHGCRWTKAGSPEWVFGARDAHRAEKHPYWKPRKKGRPRMVPLPANFADARARGTEASRRKES